jgi:hypothetical protein
MLKEMEQLNELDAPEIEEDEPPYRTAASAAKPETPP